MLTEPGVWHAESLSEHRNFDGRAPVHEFSRGLHRGLVDSHIEHPHPRRFHGTRQSDLVVAARRRSPRWGWSRVYRGERSPAW